MARGTTADIFQNRSEKGGEGGEAGAKGHPPYPSGSRN